MKKAIQDNAIGDISLIDVTVKISSLIHANYDWLCDSTMGGGCLNLIGSHVIDLINFLTDGKKALRVHAIVSTFRSTTDKINGIRCITAPDFCNFQMELEGGILVVCNLLSNQCCRNGFEQDVTIVGRDGSLVVVGGDLVCLRRKSDDCTSDFKEEKLYVDIQDLRITSNEDVSLPRPYIKGMVKMVTALKEAFSTSEGWIKEPVKSAASFNDGLYVQSVVEAIKRSSDTKSWTKVELQES